MVVQGLFRPYRAGVFCWRRTQGDASLYPGLSHFAPLGLRKGGLGTGLGARGRGGEILGFLGGGKGEVVMAFGTRVHQVFRGGFFLSPNGAAQGSPG